MKVFKVYCRKCGWEGSRLECDMNQPNECPICSTKGSISIKKEDMHKIAELMIEDNLKTTLHSFGIEKTLELISESKEYAPEVYQIYLETLKREYPLLYNIVIK